MYCIKCGEKLPDKANFCFSCGEKINNKKFDIDVTTEDKSKEIKEEHKCWYIFAVIGVFLGGVLFFLNCFLAEENPDILPSLVIIENVSLAFSILGMWSNKTKTGSILSLVINIVSFLVYINALINL